MSTRISYIITVASAFTAGICTGLMLAPQSGKNLRKRLSVEARSQLKTAEEKLEQVEIQLAKVNDRIQASGKELGNKVRDAADELIPDITSDSEQWDLTKGEMERELRNLSRR